MEKMEIELLSYDEIFILFEKIEILKQSIKNKENDIHIKILKESNSNICSPPTLKMILENDKLDKYRSEARKELLNVSLELKNIKEFN